MRDSFNRGRWRKTLPTLHGMKVEFVSMQIIGKKRWRVTLNINGWPHDMAMYAQDEIDVMKQLFAMQRGEKQPHVFDVSK